MSLVLDLCYLATYNYVLICMKNPFFIKKMCKPGTEKSPFHGYVEDLTHETWWPVLSELYFKEREKKGSFNKNKMWVNVCMLQLWNAASANSFLVMWPVQQNIIIKVFPFSPLEMWVAQTQHPTGKVQLSFVVEAHLYFHFHSSVKLAITFVEEACVLLNVSEFKSHVPYWCG